MDEDLRFTRRSSAVRTASEKTRHAHSLHRYRQALFPSNNRVALYFDLGVGDGQRSDCDESAAWEIIAEHFSADLRQAIKIGRAHV